LVLTFKQKFKETRLYKSISSQVVEALACTKCKTTVYPVSWTDDIERVYDYQKKAFTPKKATFKLKRTAWIAIITIDLIIIGSIITIFFPEVFGLK